MRRLHYREAERNFALAVKYDSTFASGWRFLSWARHYVAKFDSGDTSGIQPAIQRAVQYASRASEREQWHIAPYDPILQAKLMGEPVGDELECVLADMLCRDSPTMHGLTRNLGFLLLLGSGASPKPPNISLQQLP